ncbi:MAG: hypothetical protein RL748_4181 [Pseudomonadota bacterium]|jgi:cytochrome c556
MSKNNQQAKSQVTGTPRYTRLTICTLLLTCITHCLPTLAQGSLPIAPEKALQARQASYFLMGQQMARINATIKGDLAFDKPAMQLSADALDMLGRLVQENYVPGSDQGNTRAKAGIWKEMPRFKQMAQESQVEIVKLREAIYRADLAAIKTAYGNTSKSCKNCHDTFKEK